jgi:hypothetical protein
MEAVSVCPPEGADDVHSFAILRSTAALTFFPVLFIFIDPLIHKNGFFVASVAARLQPLICASGLPVTPHATPGFTEGDYILRP